MAHDLLPIPAQLPASPRLASPRLAERPRRRRGDRGHACRCAA